MVYIIILLVAVILASVSRKNLGIPIMVAIVASSVVSLWSPQLSEAISKLVNGVSVELIQALIEMVLVLGLASWAVFASPGGSSLSKSLVGSLFLGLALIYLLRESIAVVFRVDGLSLIIDGLLIQFKSIMFSIIAGFGLASFLASKKDS